ncbi:MAG: FAD-dependent oxidoreductase, partial [Patescibacteria group bacterium]
KPVKIYCGEEVLESEAVIIATGADDIKLNVPGEKELMGKGVAVCAVCDAAFYKDKIALVVGGGDAACEDALALTKFAKQIYLVVRRDELRASKIMAERVKTHTKIKILWKSQVKEIFGGEKVIGVKLDSGEEVKTDGVFLAIGHKPNSGIFKGQVEIDEKEFIKIGNKDYPTMTNIDGVFAAGDVVDWRYKQAVTAAGMGCQAALDVEKYINFLSQGEE